MAVSNYRKDNRTDQEFKNQIKEYSRIELMIAIAICEDQKSITGEYPELLPIGTDYTGKVQDDSKVTSDPDFMISGIKTEITHSKKHCRKHFHQKCGKVRKIISLKDTLVFADGYSLDTARYVWLNHKTLEEITDKSMKKYGLEQYHPTSRGAVKKKCHKYDIDWLENEWRPLVIPDSIPDKYKDLINNVCSETKK